MIRLENVLRVSLQGVFKMSPRCLEDVLETYRQDEYIGLEQDVLKTPWRRLLKTSSRRPEAAAKSVPRNSANFPGKQLCQRLFFNKVAGLLKKSLWHRCFSVKFAKFLRIPPEDCFWTSSSRRMFGGLLKKIFQIFIQCTKNIPLSIYSFKSTIIKLYLSICPFESAIIKLRSTSVKYASPLVLVKTSCFLYQPTLWISLWLLKHI